VISPAPVTEVDRAGASTDRRTGVGTVVPRALDDVRGALALLTRVPVGHAQVPGTGARSFPIVGALIGVAGGVPILVLGDAMPMVAAALAIALTAIVTGAIHFDGLADTADALVAVGPGASERARRDPAVGVGGIVTLILVLTLEVASLDQLIVRSGALAAACAMVVAGAASRFGPLLVTIAYRQRAAESGLGAWFASRLTRADVVVAALAAGTVVTAVGLILAVPWVIVAGASGLVVSSWSSVERGAARVASPSASRRSSLVMARRHSWPPHCEVTPRWRSGSRCISNRGPRRGRRSTSELTLRPRSEPRARMRPCSLRG
jgi:adenosylcobinamide-GDP ribazoletransferase